MRELPPLFWTSKRQRAIMMMMNNTRCWSSKWPSVVTAIGGPTSIADMLVYFVDRDPEPIRGKAIAWMQTFVTGRRLGMCAAAVLAVSSRPANLMAKARMEEQIAPVTHPRAGFELL